MRTSIIDEALRRIEGRRETRAEQREREERRRSVAQLVSEIAAPRQDRLAAHARKQRQFG